MGKLRIYCDSCGSEWDVYHRDDWKSWKSRTCPVCGKAINPETWEKQILKGFGEMEDSNIELFKDHAQDHGTLFTVSYIPDVIFPKRESKEDGDFFGDPEGISFDEILSESEIDMGMNIQHIEWEIDDLREEVNEMSKLLEKLIKLMNNERGVK